MSIARQCAMARRRRHLNQLDNVVEHCFLRDYFTIDFAGDMAGNCNYNAEISTMMSSFDDAERHCGSAPPMHG